MKFQQAKANKFVLNYGITLGVIMVTIGVIMYVTNNHFNPHWLFSIISFAAFIGLIFLGIKAYKAENNGFLSLGEAVKVGVGIALIAGIFSATWAYILSTYIEPNYFTQMAEVQQEQLLEHTPEMTDRQLEKATEVDPALVKPLFTFSITIVTNLLFGLLMGLLTGLILKKTPPNEV